jgi:hypothetical protein
MISVPYTPYLNIITNFKGVWYFSNTLLETIGISKQYKLSLFKSFVISIAPIIIIFLLIIGAIIYLIFSGTAGLQEIFEMYEERIFE